MVTASPVRAALPLLETVTFDDVVVPERRAPKSRLGGDNAIPGAGGRGGGPCSNGVGVKNAQPNCIRHSGRVSAKRRRSGVIESLSLTPWITRIRNCRCESLNCTAIFHRGWRTTSV